MHDKRNHIKYNRRRTNRLINLSKARRRFSINSSLKRQSEGTYVTDIITPSIRALLKGLPFRQFAFISTAERQSAASASRKGKGYIRKQPDFMYLQKREGKIFELVFGEY
ncbi:hypothetical protein C2G38_2177537 [Gigaspora rosea]|uniref:Uncharacterized protein n=1 Tax=Gigaspora rosea TaxID=44941 RepID=A0A397VF86_9GLOM|nr:hypothetical protein C2G38_2177537 [Gigaspora rosea]